MVLLLLLTLNPGTTRSLGVFLVSEEAIEKVVERDGEKESIEPVKVNKFWSLWSMVTACRVTFFARAGSRGTMTTRVDTSARQLTPFQYL